MNTDDRRQTLESAEAPLAANLRLALVLGTLHRRSDLEATPLDAEWLAELAESHELELFVDQASPGSEALRRAGIPVTVSVKRSVDSNGSGTISADALQARALRQAHEASPFDAVLYGSDVTVDLAWHEPTLRTIPRGVALGCGQAHDLRAVWEDRRLFARLGRLMWSQTGLIASADFVLSNVPVEAFGLRDDGTLPPRYTTGADEPQTRDAPPDARWVAVAATSLGPKGLEELMHRVVERVPPNPNTNFLVLVRPQPEAGHSASETVLDPCPVDLQRRTVVLAIGADGVAADFLEQADFVIAAAPSELAVPAIAEAAGRCGMTVLEQIEPATEAAGLYPETITPRRMERQVHVLTWEAELSRFRRTLEDISQHADDEDMLVIHAPGKAGPAVRYFGLSDLQGVDLVVWGHSEAVLGQPNPGYLYPFALMLRVAAVPALLRALGGCESIWDLVCWAASHEWMDRLRLLVLPAPAGVECWEVREVEQISTFWRPRRGLLPASQWALATAGAPPTEYPNPVQLPRRRFLSQPDTTLRVSLEAWARRSSWGERLRLVLPWKWGLLERAMRNRW